jgi:flagellar protein FliO/FliZ
MFEALGIDSIALRFFIAFLFVLALIGGAAYLVRRFGAGALNTAAARGRQPRLAVIDAAPVDGRRRLLLIRRDNVEHLLMIGGPTDVVVESNIVRAAPANLVREPTPMRPAAEPPSRQPAPAEGSMWPLQPDPAARPQRPIPLDEPIYPIQPEPTPRAVDRFADLAGELSRNAAEPAPRPAPDYGTRPAPDFPPARSSERVAERAPDFAAARPLPSRRATMMAAPQAAIQPPMPVNPPVMPPVVTSAAAPAVAPVPTPTPPPFHAASNNDEQNLAEMAHRLEAALRRPKAEPIAAEPQGGKRTVEPPVRAAAPEQAPLPAANRSLGHDAEPPHAAPELKLAPTDTKPGKTVYDSLEEEMASLLGRPSGKP